MTGPILSLSKLLAGYGGQPVVNGIDLDIARGKMITFVGPNGAGKSTLLRAIYGTAQTYDGAIAYDGHSTIERLSPLERFTLGIVFVPQGRCNFGQMTVAENLTIAAHALPSSARASAAAGVVEMFPILHSRRKILAGNLSGGEQQMLEMAMVLQYRPKCLLVDEPSLGLSPRMQEEVFTKLAELRDGGMTIVAVEQNVRIALAVSDNAAVLVQGCIVMHGSAASVNDDERIRKAYLGG